MSVQPEHVSGEEEVRAAAVPTEDQSTQPTEDERQVPLSALESEREKRQRVEEENRLIREHFTLMASQQQPQRQPMSQEELDGLDDSDVMTIGEFKKHSSRLTQQFQASVQELKMAQRYPDYQKVITTYLPDVLKTNPGLRASLEKSQDYELAYYLAKNSETYKSEHVREKKNEDAERILKNTQSTGSLSSMGATTPVSQAKRYKDMSDEEFRKVMHQNLGY